MARKLFLESEEFNLNTVKLHMLDHIVEDFARFGASTHLGLSSFERFSNVYKTFITIMSMQIDSALNEAVKMTNSSVAIEGGRNNIGEKVRKSKLALDGTVITLFQIAISTLVPFAHTDSNGRVALALQCLKSV